jgi:CHASE3 domain sensor protein
MMSEVLHANIFFFIASVATVIFFIIVTMVLYQVYKITVSIRSIIERVESASEVVAEDVAQVRELVSKRGLLPAIVGFIFGSNRKKSRSKQSAKTDD